MSRYLKAKLRIVRRLGALPALTKKTTNRKYTPGQHGQNKANKRTSISEYAVRLQEKQKLRFNYGISEKQLYNYVKRAKSLKGATGTYLLQLLEMRIDNIIYRLGFAPTIASARQIVAHGHIKLNNKKVTIPSFQCKPNDKLIIGSKTKSSIIIKKNLENFTELPKHLEFDKTNIIGKIKTNPRREDIDLKINELLVFFFK